MKKYIFFFLAFLIILFLAISQFNYICRLTNKCNPFIISYYFPKKIGEKKYEFLFNIKNNNEKLEIKTSQNPYIVMSGDDLSISYFIKNISNQDVIFKLKFFTDSEFAGQYIKLYECICNKEHKIKPNQEIKLIARFNINKKIEKENNLLPNAPITIGYEVYK